MPTRGFSSLIRIPITIPIGVERLNDINKHKDFANVKPAREKVPPREIAATILCKAILSERYPVNE
jgi:hypothetical protein